MAAILGCSWEEILQWRACYLAWHQRVTGRCVTFSAAAPEGK
jgi:hypothetical protein